MKHSFQIFTIVAILMMVVPDVFIFWRYVMPLGAWWMVGYALVSLWTVWTFVVMTTWCLGPVRSMRVFFSTFLMVVMTKLLFALSAPLVGWKVALILVIALAMAFAYGFVFGYRRLKVREVECASPDVPESFDGYRIMQVSDLHLGSFSRHPEFITKVVDTALAQHCDVVLFTGDLMNFSPDEIVPYFGTLSRLTAPDGLFSVMGNHDYVGGHANKVRDLQRQMGWRLLDNAHHVVRRGTDAIALVGVENMGNGPFVRKGDLAKALGALPKGMFKVLLSHDPSHWRREVLGSSDVQLTLSGHTHGAQLCVGRFSPAWLTYHEWGGAYHSDGRMLYVSLGIGGTVPFRLGPWPEINVITLRRKYPSSENQSSAPQS